MDRAAAIYARALDDLERRMGVDRSLIRAEETVALVRAAERVANPFGEVNADAAGIPVRVSEGVYFHPLTIGAAVWLEETADRWWADDPRRYRNALVYAAVNARDPNAFGCVDRDGAESAIRKCLRRVTATSDETDLALGRLLSGSSARPGDVEGTAAGWARLVAEIEAGTGIERRHWLWDVSCRETLRTYHEMRTAALARGGKTCERMLDELDRAVNDLQSAKIRIMKRTRDNG